MKIQRLIRPKEARFALGGISRATLWRWVQKGILRQPVRIEGISGWPEDELKALISRKSTDSEYSRITPHEPK
jgi:predicted DNA-binding transcriptional regulator AlpA